MTSFGSKAVERPSTNTNSPFAAIGTIFVDDDGVKISAEKEMKSDKKESFFQNLIKRESSTEHTGINAAWAKLGVILPSKEEEEDDDKQSMVSNESYGSTKDLLDSQEILPEISRLLTSRNESTKGPSKTATAVPLVEIGIEITSFQEEYPLAVDKKPINITPSLHIPDKKSSTIPTTLLTSPTSLLVPGSDVVHIRRSSFSGMLKPNEFALKPTDQPKLAKKAESFRQNEPASLVLSTPSIGLAPPESTAKRKKSVVSFAVSDESQSPDKATERSKESPPITILTTSNDSKETPAPSILKQSQFATDEPKTVKVNDPNTSALSSAPNTPSLSASVAKTINAWKKLKNDAKIQSVQRPSNSSSDANKTKFTGFSQIVDVVKDLKTLGLEANLIVSFFIKFNFYFIESNRYVYI